MGERRMVGGRMGWRLERRTGERVRDGGRRKPGWIGLGGWAGRAFGRDVPERRGE